MASVPHNDTRTSYLLKSCNWWGVTICSLHTKEMSKFRGTEKKTLGGGTRWSDNTNLLLLQRSVLPRRQPVCRTTTTKTTCILSRTTLITTRCNKTCLNKDCSPLHHWNGCINASGVESSPNWTRSLFTNKPPPKMVDGDKSAWEKLLTVRESE